MSPTTIITTTRTSDPPPLQMELQTLSPIHHRASSTKPTAPTTHISPTTETPDWTAATAPPDPTNIIEASRLADSTCPDGGYGWVVVTASAVLAWWFIGTSYCWGIIQSPLVEDGLASASTLAFVGSLMVACNAIFASWSARVLRWLGARGTAGLGVVFMGCGAVLSGWCTGSVGGLFVCTGLVMGIGISHMYMAVTTITAQYFSKKRGLSNGIIYAGGGLGGAVSCLAINRLIEQVGVAWTYRILGFMILTTGLPASLFLKERAAIQSKKFIDRRLLRDYRFIFIFLAGATGTFPLLVPSFFIPLYAASIGLSSGKGAALVAGFNFSSAVGRIASGFLADVIGPLNTLFISFVITAVSILALWPVSSSIAPLAIFVVINGASNGGFFSTMPTVVGNVFGSARMAVAMGMIVTGWTGGYLLGAPIAGFMLNAYGGEDAGFEAYRPAIFWAGSMSAAAAGLTAFVRLKINPMPTGKL